VPIIAIYPAEELAPADVSIAPTRSRTPGEGGGHVPGGLAGYTYDGAAYCPECAEEVRAECADDGETYTLARFPSDCHDPNGFGVGIVSCTDEWDYPGAACDVCHDLLDTNVLVYDDGGAHPTPVVEAMDPDRVRDPVTAFVVEEGERDVRIMLAESFGSHGDPGDTSWVPRESVIGL
jgi:hypothetical protein